MEELNTPIFAQAKVEYTSQLVDILYPHMFDGVKSIYDESKLLYRSKGTPILLIFRELLEKVPIWNGEIIDSECSRIINNSNCDYIDDLITAVFISHTKILTSIGNSKSFQKINLTIPKTGTFIHKCYINAARELWKNPYLFNENVPGHEFQKNNKGIEDIIKRCIENTIRKSLPIKDILKEHLEGETDSILNQRETLKQMLREELSNFSPPKPSRNNQNNHNNHNNVEDDFIENEDNDGEDNSGHESPEGQSIQVLSDIGPTIVKEDNNISDLSNKLSEIINSENKIQDLLDETSPSPATATAVYPVQETFSSSGDPGDPTEEQVSKACSNIVVNDITIPVDVPGSTDVLAPLQPPLQPPVQPIEIKYDNVDITTDLKSDSSDKLKKFMTNMQVSEEVNVVKSDILATSLSPIETTQPQQTQQPQQPSFSFDNLYPDMNNTDNTGTKSVNDPIVKPLIIDETKPALSLVNDTTQEPKSPRKEMVSVNGDDIDETSSLAHFFDDMKRIVEEKGIKIETNNDKMFTLFEDANEVEK